MLAKKFGKSWGKNAFLGLCGLSSDGARLDSPGLCGLSPEGARLDSPGRSPGTRCPRVVVALKGRDNRTAALDCCAPSGLAVIMETWYPGRCPGLSSRAPLGLSTEPFSTKPPQNFANMLTNYLISHACNFRRHGRGQSAAGPLRATATGRPPPALGGRQSGRPQHEQGRNTRHSRHCRRPQAADEELSPGQVLRGTKDRPKNYFRISRDHN